MSTSNSCHLLQHGSDVLFGLHVCICRSGLRRRREGAVRLSSRKLHRVRIILLRNAERARKLARKHTRMYIRTRNRARTHTHTYTHIHTYTHTHTHTRGRAHTHTHRTYRTYLIGVQNTWEQDTFLKEVQLGASKYTQ